MSCDQANALSLAKAKSEFLERHLLNWVPIANTKVQRTGAPGFPTLMDLLLRFLNSERAV